MRRITPEVIRDWYSTLVGAEVRFQDGVGAWLSNDDANHRMQEALNGLAPLAPMLFEPTEGQEVLEREKIYPQSEPAMFDRWSQDLLEVARDAGLTLSLQRPTAKIIGGRRGVHGAAFPAALDEMTEVYRVEPEAAW